MSKKDRDLKSISHSDEPSVPFDPGFFPRIHIAKARHKSGETTTGMGWSREEADQDLGKRISRGKRDKWVE